MATSTPEFDRAATEMYKHWETAMTSWWDQVLESPAFLGTVGKGLGQATAARGQYTKAVDAWLEQAHLPTRDDLVRLLRVCSQLEDRLLAQEDLLLELKDKLAATEKASLEARIAAAEARVELNERFDALEARLLTPTPAAPPPAPGPPAPPRDAPRRGRGA